jgi:hypothetical protein
MAEIRHSGAEETLAEFCTQSCQHDLQTELKKQQENKLLYTRNYI